MASLKAIMRCAAALLPLIVWTAADTASAAVIKVKIVDMEFVPADVSVKAGDSVEWVNTDFVDHTATAVDGEFDVKIDAGKSASQEFTKLGTLKYFCKFHPNMVGVVRVVP